MLSRAAVIVAFSMFAMPAIAASLPCPNGITATFRGGGTREYNGGDPSDPLICLSTVQRPAAGTESGFTRIVDRNLSGFYHLDAGNDPAPARGAAPALLLRCRRRSRVHCPSTHECARFHRISSAARH